MFESHMSENWFKCLYDQHQVDRGYDEATQKEIHIGNQGGKWPLSSLKKKSINNWLPFYTY